MASVVTRHRRPRTGMSVSIGLIAALVVLIAVVLTFSLNTIDRADRNTAPAAPVSYYVPGGGEGFVGGSDDQVVAALKAHTGKFQGEGRMQTTGDVSVTRPIARYEPSAGEGLVGGNLGLTDTLPSEARTALTYDEIVFQEWNDPLGWRAIPGVAAVRSAQEMAFWEQNVLFGSGAVAETLVTSKVDSYARMRFLEANTYLPGWSEGAKLASDRQGLTQF